MSSSDKQLVDTILFEMKEDYGLEVERNYVKKRVKEYSKMNLTNIKNIIITEILENL